MQHEPLGPNINNAPCEQQTEIVTVQRISEPLRHLPMKITSRWDAPLSSPDCAVSATGAQTGLNGYRKSYNNITNSQHLFSFLPKYAMLKSYNPKRAAVRRMCVDGLFYGCFAGT